MQASFSVIKSNAKSRGVRSSHWNKKNTAIIINKIDKRKSTWNFLLAPPINPRTM